MYLDMPKFTVNVFSEDEVLITTGTSNKHHLTFADRLTALVGHFRVFAGGCRAIHDMADEQQFPKKVPPPPPQLRTSMFTSPHLPPKASGNCKEQIG